MEIYKVVRKVRGKYYSAIVIQGKYCKEYGLFTTRAPRRKSPLTGFSTAEQADKYFSIGHKPISGGGVYELWKAKGTISKKKLKEDFLSFPWPRGTVFCSKIKLLERVEL